MRILSSYNLMSKMEDDSIVQAYHAEYLPSDREGDGLLHLPLLPLGTFLRNSSRKTSKIVVDHLKKIYRGSPSILRSCLRWSWLIQERSHFRDLLPEAKAEARKPQPSEKDEFTASIGKPVARESNVKTPAHFGGRHPSSPSIRTPFSSSGSKCRPPSPIKTVAKGS